VRQGVVRGCMYGARATAAGEGPGCEKATAPRDRIQALSKGLDQKA